LSCARYSAGLGASDQSSVSRWRERVARGIPSSSGSEPSASIRVRYAYGMPYEPATSCCGIIGLPRERVAERFNAWHPVSRSELPEARYPKRFECSCTTTRHPTGTDGGARSRLCICMRYAWRLHDVVHNGNRSSLSCAIAIIRPPVSPRSIHPTTII